MKHILLVASFVAFFSSAFSLGVGDKIREISLSDPYGKMVSISNFFGKVMVIFYVDPDVSNINEKFSKVLRKKKFPLSSYQSIAVINLVDTWKPNFVIRQLLKVKQKRYERAVFLVDGSHKFSKLFGLFPTDNQFITMVFDKNGFCKFIHYGVITNINKVISLIENTVKERKYGK